MLNTGLKKVPCTLLLSTLEAKMRKYLPVLTDSREREQHRIHCSGWMFVHEDVRVCSLVKKHTNN
jgi:hypothetical protein